jgi:hypothetical protein
MLLPKAGYKINIIIYSKKSIKKKTGEMVNGRGSDRHIIHSILLWRR